MSVRDDTRVFHLSRFLAEGEHPVDSSSAPNLLILNQPISSFVEFTRLWKHTSYRICADGGANRLYDMFVGELDSERDNYLPDSIHGDLDSLRNDVKAYYSARGVEVSQDRGQMSTDFGKAMQKIPLKNSSEHQRDILILGTLAGRVDQGLGLLHEMFREESQDESLRLWLFSETSLSFVLMTRKTLVLEAQSSGLFQKYIGLLPVYGPSTLTTKGLEWDVTNWQTAMGGQVSTSNHAIADEIHVETTAPILFTIQRAPLGENGKQ